MLLTFQSKRETMFYYPTDPSEKYSVFAVRWGKYKAHYYTRGTLPSDFLTFTFFLHVTSFFTSHNSGATHSETTPDQDCSLFAFQKYHDPPLLFDLESDPSENYNLTGPDWDSVRKQIKVLKEQFEATMVFGESEIGKGKDPDLQPCCTPDCSPKPDCCRCSSELWWRSRSQNGRLPRTAGTVIPQEKWLCSEHEETYCLLTSKSLYRTKMYASTLDFYIDNHGKMLKWSLKSL